MEGKTFLTVPEFAQAAGISKQAVYQAINSGKLRGYTRKSGRQMQLDAVALVEVYGKPEEGIDVNGNSKAESIESSDSSKESKESKEESSKNSQVSKENQAESSELSKDSQVESSNLNQESKESKEESSKLNQESKADSTQKPNTNQPETKEKSLQNQSELVKSLQAEVEFLREELRNRRTEAAELRKIIGMQQLKLAAPAERPADSDQGATQEEERTRTAEAPGADPEGPEAEQAAEGMPDKEEKAADPDELQRLQAALKAQEQRTQEEQRKREEVEAQLTAERKKSFFQWLRGKFGNG